MLAISMDGFKIENDIENKNLKRDILEKIGGLITFLSRASDIACKYDGKHIYILLPDTEKENVLILEKRVREALEKHDFIAASEIKFKFSSIQFDNEETLEAFVSRAQDLLN